MEPVSVFTSLLNFVRGAFSWLLKLFGKKVVNIDDFKSETYKVKMDYPEKSSECIREKEAGATFRWSQYDTAGYERYFEIDGITRKYFWNDSKQYLLIKRNNLQ